MQLRRTHVPLAALALMLAGLMAPAAGAQNLGNSTGRTADKATEAFPQSWYYRSNGVAALRSLEGKPAPKLEAAEWIGKPQDLKKLRGKIVVVDFWATWCGPCKRAIPHNIEMTKKYGDDVVIIGMHDAKRGWDKASGLVEQMGINYPVALDKMGTRTGVSTEAWRVPFWPSYIVVDRKGIVRAAGLTPNNVDNVIDVLRGTKTVAQIVAEQSAGKSTSNGKSTGSGKAEAGHKWNEGSAKDRARLSKLIAMDAPPALEVDNWINSDPLYLEDLKGKVVLLDFWATWCGPCIRAVPHTNELHEKFGKDGLVIIGVCHMKRADRMAAIAEQHGIKYPICADTTGKTNAAYAVNGYPDYYFIDRSGKLRVADCRNASVDEVIKVLLAEKPATDG